MDTNVTLPERQCTIEQHREFSQKIIRYSDLHRDFKNLNIVYNNQDFPKYGPEINDQIRAVALGVNGLMHGYDWHKPGEVDCYVDQNLIKADPALITDMENIIEPLTAKHTALLNAIPKCQRLKSKKDAINGILARVDIQDVERVKHIREVMAPITPDTEEQMFNLTEALYPLQINIHRLTQRKIWVEGLLSGDITSEDVAKMTAEFDDIEKKELAYRVDFANALKKSKKEEMEEIRDKYYHDVLPGGEGEDSVQKRLMHWHYRDILTSEGSE